MGGHGDPDFGGSAAFCLADLAAQASRRWLGSARPVRARRYCAVILLHCASAACLTEAIGIFAAAVRQARFALPSAVLTFALLVVIWLQACSAVDRALEFWIFLVASRHLCLAAATPLPEPAVVDVVVDVEDDVEALELPHHAAIIGKPSRSWSTGPSGALKIPLTTSDRPPAGVSIPRSITHSMRSCLQIGLFFEGRYGDLSRQSCAPMASGRRL